MNGFTNMMKLLCKGVAGLSPSCKEATRLQSLALDHQLTFFQRLGLRIHLALCKWCRRYGTQITFLRSASQRCAHDDLCSPPQALSSEARERIKRRLEADNKS